MVAYKCLLELYVETLRVEMHVLLVHNSVRLVSIKISCYSGQRVPILVLMRLRVLIICLLSNDRSFAMILPKDKVQTFPYKVLAT